jgi:Zn ribbon nucleic-acid-binding protein
MWHTLSKDERLELIASIGEKLAGVPVEVRFSQEEDGFIFLRVVGGDHHWAVKSSTEHVAESVAEQQCVLTMLLSLAHDAGVCPKCRAEVPRRPWTDAAFERYECDACGFEWPEQAPEEPEEAEASDINAQLCALALGVLEWLEQRKLSPLVLAGVYVDGERVTVAINTAALKADELAPLRQELDRQGVHTIDAPQTAPFAPCIALHVGGAR